MKSLFWFAVPKGTEVNMAGQRHGTASSRNDGRSRKLRAHIHLQAQNEQNKLEVA